MAPYFPNIFFPDTQTQVSGTDAGLPVRPIDQANDASWSFVSGSTALVTLLAANPSRVGAKLYNTGANLNLQLAPGMGSGSYSVKMASNSYFELPKPVYTGVIKGYWDANTGNPVVRITEDV